MQDGIRPQFSDLMLHRPWVTALNIEGMPLELRVFVIDGKLVAVANYYLQRDLPDTELVRRSAREALDATREGAHPCMFLLPDHQGVADLEGLRLGSALPTIPLSNLE